EISLCRDHTAEHPAATGGNHNGTSMWLPVFQHVTDGPEEAGIGPVIPFRKPVVASGVAVDLQDGHAALRGFLHQIVRVASRPSDALRPSFALVIGDQDYFSGGKN